MKKQLFATVDFYDDLIHAGRLFGVDDLDRMMTCLARMGVSRVDWIVDTVWDRLYEIPVGKFSNVLHAAIDRAHAHGMECHALIKPFERGIEGPRTLFPHTAPQPPDVPLVSDLRGIICAMDAFVAAHPEMRYRRRPDGEDSGKPVGAIRLVKQDASPTRLKAKDLSVHVSDRNGVLHPYVGTFTLSEHVEWRDVFLAPGEKRILTIAGLNIDPRQRYVFVKCAPVQDAPDFGNTPLELMELLDTDGKTIPVSSAESRLDPEAIQLRFPEWEITRYGKHPEVRAFFADRARVIAACAEFFQYDRSTLVPYRGGPVYLDRRGFAGVARGKAPTLLGTLSPHYPDVRAYWLTQIEGFLDAGADGVNIRHANHGTKSHDREAYGFDDPVLDASAGRVDYDVAHRVNGKAYTDFLREASRRVHARKKSVTLHVHGYFFYRDERTTRTSDNTPPVPNLDFQWETWLEQGMADIIYLKGIGFTPARTQHVIDRVTRVAAECGLPVIHSGLRLNVPREVMTKEMRRVVEDDRLSAFDLYEVANFARLTESGDFVADSTVEKAAHDFLEGNL